MSDYYLQAQANNAIEKAAADRRDDMRFAIMQAVSIGSGDVAEDAKALYDLIQKAGAGV